eukprot:scaffold32261_cov61-Phaeocystis_antarctica.AAC.2
MSQIVTHHALIRSAQVAEIAPTALLGPGVRQDGPGCLATHVYSLTNSQAGSCSHLWSHAVALLDVPPRAKGTTIAEIHVAARARVHPSVILLRALRRRAFDARALLTVCLRGRGVAAAAAAAAKPVARTAEGGARGRLCWHGCARAGGAHGGRPRGGGGSGGGLRAAAIAEVIGHASGLEVAALAPARRLGTRRLEQHQGPLFAGGRLAERVNGPLSAKLAAVGVGLLGSRGAEVVVVSTVLGAHHREDKPPQAADGPADAQFVARLGLPREALGLLSLEKPLERPLERPFHKRDRLATFPQHDPGCRNRLSNKLIGAGGVRFKAAVVIVLVVGRASVDCLHARPLFGRLEVENGGTGTRGWRNRGDSAADEAFIKVW